MALISLVDPLVSRTKFEREVAAYREIQEGHIRRGWLLLKAEFPEVYVVFAAPQLKPPVIIFGVLLDFSNYDLWPPSVTLVHPFTKEPYKRSELPTILKRRVVQEVLVGDQTQKVPTEQPLMQAHNADDVPFLCIPGVREYHEHPGHSGDSWLTHRGGAVGTLYFILNQLSKYGVEPLTGFNLALQVQIAGFQQQTPPD